MSKKANPDCISKDDFVRLIDEFTDGCVGLPKYDWFGLNRHACCRSFAIWLSSTGTEKSPQTDYIEFCGSFRVIWRRDLTGWGQEKIRRFLAVLYKEIIPHLGLHHTDDFWLRACRYSGEEWERIINHVLAGGKIEPAIRVKDEEPIKAKIIGNPLCDPKEWPTNWLKTKQEIDKENLRREKE